MMTFLNPLVLFGLAAAAIPILIHLLNLRKLKVIEFSSLRFLKEMQKTRMRRLRLRQWLILLLRTLLIVFLVLAFARPALKGSLGSPAGTHATSTVVILLDDSPSMGTRNDRGILFEQAKEAVSQFLSTVSASDEVYLFRLSDPFDPSSTPLPIAPAAALTALEGMSITERSVPYAPLVAHSLRTLAASQNANKELLLITDGQGTQFSFADTSGPPHPDIRKEVGVFFAEFSPSRRENSAVTSLTLESRLLSPGRPIVFRAAITNYGDQRIENVPASLYLDGSRVAQQSVTLPPYGSATVTMAATVKRRGILPASVQIDDDALEIDNRRFLVLNIPEHIAVTLVGSTTADTRYPALALTAAADSVQAGTYTVQQTTRDRLQFTDISTQDAIVLCNIRSLTPAESGRIRDIVKAGRSLVVFPGPDTDYDQLNAGLLTALAIPPIARPEPRTPDSSQTSFLSFAGIDYGHPVFEGIFQKSPDARISTPTIESPRILTAAGIRTGATGIPVITMSDGRPFLCEYSAGNGKALLFAVESGSRWSDFPFKGLFAPLLHRTVLYLTSQQQPPETTNVGEPLRFAVRLSPEQSGKAFIARTPSGTEVRVQPERQTASGLTVFRTEAVRETGIHLLIPAGGGAETARPVQAAAVHCAAAESDLRQVDEDALAAFWDRKGVSPDRIHRTAAPDAIPRLVQESRYGVELWRYFLLIALACALAEMILSRAGTPVAGTEAHAHDST